MKDCPQMPLEVSAQNSMALKALSSVSVKESSVFSMENVPDDDISEENFHLHLSEDEDDEKTEKKEETKVSASEVAVETEDDILDKFDTDGITLDNVDDKLEETLLSDGEDEVPNKKLKDDVVTTENSILLENKEGNSSKEDLVENEGDVEENKKDETLVETEVGDNSAENKNLSEEGRCNDDTLDTKLPNDNCQDLEKDCTTSDKNISENNKVADKTIDTVKVNGDSEHVSEMEIEKVGVDSEKENEKMCEDRSAEEKTDKNDEHTPNSEESLKTPEAAEDVETNHEEVAAIQEQTAANQEEVNAEILKNQIMDTEDLLQIVDKDPEESNDKDSSGGNSPRSVDKGDSEDTEMECNDTETEKADHDEEEENDEEKAEEKDEDGVDIEEDFLDDNEQLNKEYENLVKGKDLEEQKSSSKEQTKENADSTDSSDKNTVSVDESQDIPNKEANLEENIEMDTSNICDESSKNEQDEKIVDEDGNMNEKDKIGEPLNNVTKVSPGEKPKSPEKTKDNDSETATNETVSKPSKRLLSDSEEPSDAKKLKLQETSQKEASKDISSENINTGPDYDEITPSQKVIALNCISEYMRKKNLRKFTLKDLEELCVLKICETVGHRSEIGELRHQLGMQEQMIEMWRKETAQLTKQARDLEIVNKRLLHEVRMKNDKDKPLIPVKITRSVGLQVRCDNNMINNVLAPKRKICRPQPSANTIAPAKQNRYIQNRSNNNINNITNKVTPANKVTLTNKVASTNKVTPTNKPTPTNKATSTSKVINSTVKVVSSPTKIVNSPSKIVTTTPVKPKILPTKSPNPSLLSQALQNSTQAAQTAAISTATSSASHIPTATPTTPTIASAPSIASNTTATTSSPSSIANKTVASATPKPTAKSVESKTFIDLTDEDDKKPTSVGTATPTTITASPAQGVRIVPAPFKPGNVVTSAGVVNPPRIMYFCNNQLQGVLADPAKGGGQKFMLKLNSNVIGSANGVLTAIPNGSPISVGNTAIRASQVQPVRLSSPVTTARTTTTTTKAALKHPAPLPPTPTSQTNLPGRKPVPPKPHLSIRRSSGGIVLSWKMPYNLDNFETIASYQLYAYQETTSPPSSDMWRKVGDVKALALPMACTLTQFADGNKYHFAVRAVDVQKRMGPFSDPEQILL